MNGVAWLVLACALAVVVLVWAEYRAAQPMRVVAKLAASSAFVAIAWRLGQGLRAGGGVSAIAQWTRPHRVCGRDAR